MGQRNKNMNTGLPGSCSTHLDEKLRKREACCCCANRCCLAASAHIFLDGSTLIRLCQYSSKAELSSLRWRHAAGDVADGRTDTADAAADVAGGDVGGDAGGRGGVPLLRSALYTGREWRHAPAGVALRTPRGAPGLLRSSLVSTLGASWQAAAAAGSTSTPIWERPMDLFFFLLPRFHCQSSSAPCLHRPVERDMRSNLPWRGVELKVFYRTPAG